MVETFVRSILTYLIVGLYIVVIGPPALVLTTVFKWQGLLYTLGRVGIRLGRALAGIRVRIAGRRPDASRAVVFCANHQSNIDPPVLFEVLHPRLHVLHKAELLKLPLLGRAMRIGGFVAVDRSDRDRSFQAISEAAASARAGNSFLIFPEGTRSRTEALLPFKKGGFIMAIEAQIPVVPVAIMGGRAAMRKGSAIVRPVTISVRVGAPIETQGMGIDDRDRLVEQARAQIEALLAHGPIVPGEARG